MKHAIASDVDTGSEELRLGALYRYDVLDTPSERSFDRITLLAKAVFGVPIALVSLVDRDRQWFKSRQGLEATETPRQVAFCRFAIEQDTPLIIPDATQDPRVNKNPLVLGAPHIRFYAGAPLITPGGHRIGTLCVIDQKPRQVSDEQLVVLRELSRIVVEELELRALAYTDSLTGVLTRRAFNECAAREMLRSRRHERPVTFALLDIDHFKRVNDTYGHAIGDAVLLRVVQAMSTELRGCDTVGRFGGEEFAIMLPECDAESGRLAAERVRAAVAGTAIESSHGRLTVTASIGLAEYRACDADLSLVMQKADRALYFAKRSGRNCVVCDGELSRFAVNGSAA